MDFVTLGRTGLRCSVVGLGAGGHSRLGLNTGKSHNEAVMVVRRALELGINLVDTAEVYGTEEVVGAALADGPRDSVVVSTKKSPTGARGLIAPDELVAGLHMSLKRLRTDRVEIYHMHGVRPDQYAHVREHLVPALFSLREQGKIGWLGITEAFAGDTGHLMLSQAVKDDCWDVMMVGFNILNQSARERVLVHTMAHNIGVLGMFAVRRALSQPEALRQTIAELGARRLIDPDLLNVEAPLDFLLHAGGASTLTEAAYRFCRAEPGIDVVLSGTGNVDHLDQNVAAILQPPLPEADRARLVDLFQRVDTVSGQ